jgi:hypothetical protein
MERTASEYNRICSTEYSAALRQDKRCALRPGNSCVPDQPGPDRRIGIRPGRWLLLQRGDVLRKRLARREKASELTFRGILGIIHARRDRDKGGHRLSFEENGACLQ